MTTKEFAIILHTVRNRKKNSKFGSTVPWVHFSYSPKVIEGVERSLLFSRNVLPIRFAKIWLIQNIRNVVLRLSFRELNLVHQNVLTVIKVERARQSSFPLSLNASQMSEIKTKAPAGSDDFRCLMEEFIRTFQLPETQP